MILQSSHCVKSEQEAATVFEIRQRTREVNPFIPTLRMVTHWLMVHSDSSSTQATIVSSSLSEEVSLPTSPCPSSSSSTCPTSFLPLRWNADPASTLPRPRLACAAEKTGLKFFLRVGVAKAPTGFQLQVNILSIAFLAVLKKRIKVSQPEAQNWNSLVVFPAKAQDGPHHLVSIQLLSQRARHTGGSTIGATAEETYVISEPCKMLVYLHLEQAERPWSRQASLHSTVTSSMGYTTEKRNYIWSLEQEEQISYRQCPPAWKSWWVPSSGSLHCPPWILDASPVVGSSGEGTRRCLAPPLYQLGPSLTISLVVLQ